MLVRSPEALRQGGSRFNIFVHFMTYITDESGDIDDCVVQVNMIHRDVSWREATWEKIRDASMPMDPAAWREDGDVGGSVPGIPMPPPLATLLTRLPSVSLPSDIPRFSCFNVNPRLID